MITEELLAGALVDEPTLIEFIRSRRWFGAKADEIAHASLLDGIVVRSQPPMLVATVAEVRFQPGTHDLYQVLLGVRPADDGWEGEAISSSNGWVVYEALADPQLSRELVHLMRGETTLRTGDSAIEFRPLTLAGFGPDLSTPRVVKSEQSNTSVVFGDELILKVYRRLEAGVNPELELVRFLTTHGFANVAGLAGWYEYSGRLMGATLGILQEFVPDAVDGWQLAVAEIGSRPGDFVARLQRLGEVTGDMHTVLASDRGNPDFCPEEPSAEALGILVATVDEEIERVFAELPDEDVLRPIAGRGEEVREQLRMISHVGPVGRVIRHHGDYHLGQVLWSNDDWVVLDFEGEPARALPERRRKRSPLRDVAGMLRSFAYVVSAAQAGGTEVAPGWEEEARSAFLAGYFARADQSIVPSGEDARARLLAIYELEKAVYELRYELNNRPEWAGIPVAGILRLLEAPV